MVRTWVASVMIVVALALGALLGVLLERSVTRAAAGVPLPAEIAWGPNPFLSEGSRLATVAGSPQATGAYAMRITFPEGFEVMPHSHPDERAYTVLSGAFEIGLGATFDTTKFTVSEPGEVIRVPARALHFHRARSATEFQVNGLGPTGITYVDSAQDPRRRP